MVASSYTTDLTTVATGDLVVDAGTWDESSDAGWDTGGAMVDDQNLYYNNSECVSAQMTKDATTTGAGGPASILYEHTSTVTVPADGAVLIHHLWAAPPALNTIANGGVHIIVGNSLADFYAWDISGSDFAPAPKGGWANYAINPVIGSPDDTVGSPTGTPYDTFGMAVSAAQQARGNPNAVNAIRWGRCEAIFTGGEVADYCTFLGFGDTDSTITNKWSLIDPVEGGYKWQGLMSLGSTGTAVDFRDSNVNITVANTIKVTVGFNAIEVNHIDSNVSWTAINITALGTVSIGTFEAIANATIAKTNCVFTDMGTFDYLSNSTLTNTTYRRCGLTTQGGATFIGCTFDEMTNAYHLTADDLDLVTGCTFNSDGTGHAIYIPNGSTGTFDFTGHTFTGYATTLPTAPGSTGNEVIYNDSGGSVILNASGITGIISVRNGSGASTTVNNNVNVTITVQTSAATAIVGAQVAIFKSSDDSVLQSSVPTDDSGQVVTSVAESSGAIYIRVRQSTNTATFDTNQAFGSEILTTDAIHSFVTAHGEAVVYDKDGGTAAVGLTDGTTYYVHYLSTTTLTLHTSAADAISNTAPVNLTTDAAGETHKLDPIRYFPTSTVGTVGTDNLGITITMTTDTTATG